MFRGLASARTLSKPATLVAILRLFALDPFERALNRRYSANDLRWHVLRADGVHFALSEREILLKLFDSDATCGHGDQYRSDFYISLGHRFFSFALFRAFAPAHSGQKDGAAFLRFSQRSSFRSPCHVRTQRQVIPRSRQTASILAPLPSAWRSSRASRSSARPR